MEDILVFRFGRHRVVERRDKEHHKNRNAEDAHAYCGLHLFSTLRIGLHRRKGQSHKRQDTHYAVRYGIAYLLTK